MAIKIDLLPGYVGLKRWFKRAILSALALLAVVASVLGLFWYRDKLQLQKLVQDVSNIKPFADQTVAAQQAKTAAYAQTQPIRVVVDFMADAGKTGPERAALLDLMRRYIYGDQRNGAVVSAIDLSDGTSAKMRVTVRTPDDYARFLTTLRRGSQQENGPLWSSLPNASGIPGFPEGRPAAQVDAQGISYVPQPIPFPLSTDAVGVLREPMRIPVEPTGTTSGAAAPDAGSGYPGSGSSSSSGYPSGSGSSSSSGYPSGSSSSSGYPSR